jgi:uncharacterized membrane protein YedE/YeeE
MANLDFASPLAGGALIGLAASVFLLVTGRVAGISGIATGLVSAVAGDRLWRVLFVVGLLAGGAIAAAGLGAHPGDSPASLPLLAVSGALVGVGVTLGAGCTSGHGVCGLSRGSIRSLVATLTFMATGALSATVMRLLGGS